MKYPSLFDAFSKVIDLPLNAYLALEEKIEVKHLTKKEFLIEGGKKSNYLPFINKGLMVNYRVADDGSRHVIQIHSGGAWLGDLYSFFSGNSSLFNIQAFQETELLLINKETFDMITKEYPIYERYFRMNIQKAYVYILNQIYNLHSLSAEERYLELINRIPNILEDLPHYLIASYLNIQSQSLSRIRKKIKEEGHSHR